MDLAHATNHVYRDALERGYVSICILEDDFFLVPGQPTRSDAERVTREIREYTTSSAGTPFTLMLGCVPLCTGPAHDTHFRTVYCSMGTHALIHNRSALELLAQANRMLFDVDMILNQVTYARRDRWVRVIYERPLVFQVYGDTANNRLWGANTNLLSRVVAKSCPLVQRSITHSIRSVIFAFGLESARPSTGHTGRTRPPFV